jgi:hypothetical protein
VPEKNRLISWDSNVQELNQSNAGTSDSKGTTMPSHSGLANKMTKLILATAVRLPTVIFKVGYELAKLATRGLSRVRRLFSRAN